MSARTRKLTARTSIAAGAVLAAAALAIGPATAVPAEGPDSAAIPEYEMQELPVPSGIVDASITAGSPDGSIFVGNGFNADDESVPLIWEDGEVRKFEPPRGAETMRFIDVNDVGQIVGLAIPEDEPSYPVIYSDGLFNALEPPADGSIDTNVVGITDGGVAVAHGTRTETTPGEQVVVRWDAETPSNPEVSEPFGDGEDELLDVDGNGTVLVGSPAEYSTLTEDDVKKELPEVSGVPDDYVETPIDITGQYVVGGVSYDDGEAGTSVLWDLEQERAISFEGIDADQDASARAVNSEGLAVGSTDEDEAAVMDAATGITTLPTDGFDWSEAETVSETGNIIAGSGEEPGTGKEVPVIWTNTN